MRVTIFFIGAILIFISAIWGTINFCQEYHACTELQQPEVQIGLVGVFFIIMTFAWPTPTKEEK